MMEKRSVQIRGLQPAKKYTEAEWYAWLENDHKKIATMRDEPEYEPQYEVFLRINQMRYRVYGERQEVEQIEIDPTLYEAAYLEMNSQFWREGSGNPFPLPVPECEYRMWGVRVRKAA